MLAQLLLTAPVHSALPPELVVFDELPSTLNPVHAP